MKYYKRLLEEKLKRAVNQFPVVVLTGPRQSGKSTLLRHLYPDYRYITFDDPLLRQNAKEDPGLFIEIVERPVILDEIQYVPEVMPYIKMVVDKNRRETGQFILTGSQVFNLMERLSESLAGRAAILELLPFSMEEIDASETKGLNALFRACFKGFFPDPAVHHVNPNLFYGSYLQTYIERDIRQLKSVQDTALFQRFIGILAARSASLLNISNVANSCGVSHTTAQNWLSLLESSRIIYLLRPYLPNLGKRLVKSSKLYFTDTGLLAYLLRYPTAETLQYGPSAPAVFENYIVMEALKYKFNYSALVELFYYRDSNKNEIDLIVEAARNLYLYEIKLKQNILKRDFKVLESFPETDKTVRRFIVSAYTGAIYLSKKVKNIPWQSFGKEIFKTDSSR